MILITEGNRQYYLRGSMLSNTTRSNTVTSYPTVEGTSFSDHAYREPDSVSFSLQSSDISKSLIYEMSYVDGVGTVVNLSLDEVVGLLSRWFSTVPRLGITTLRHHFNNQVLKSYSWSDQELAVFNPTLEFVEARTQSLRVGKIENPDQYYQAAYGTVISTGNSVTVQSEANIGTALFAAGAGALVGAKLGSMILPGWGTAIGTIVGGAIGFFGTLYL